MPHTPHLHFINRDRKFARQGVSAGHALTRFARAAGVDLTTVREMRAKLEPLEALHAGRPQKVAA